jgi:hypothetical protein
MSIDKEKELLLNTVVSKHDLRREIEDQYDDEKEYREGYLENINTHNNFDQATHFLRALSSCNLQGVLLIMPITGHTKYIMGNQNLYIEAGYFAFQ